MDSVKAAITPTIAIWCHSRSTLYKISPLLAKDRIINMEATNGITSKIEALGRTKEIGMSIKGVQTGTNQINIENFRGNLLDSSTKCILFHLL